MLIGLLYESEEIFIFYDYKKQIMCVRVDDGKRRDQDSFDSTPVNTPLSIEMEGRPFYTVCLTPNLSSRLSGTMCYDLMDRGSTPISGHCEKSILVIQTYRDPSSK